MSVSAIGTAQYLATEYGAKKAAQRTAGKSFAGHMDNAVQKTQMPSGAFELHISNDIDGKVIGAGCGNDYSFTVYEPKDFDPANPVYKMKVWDKDGNVTEQSADMSKVDARNSDYLSMYAYSSYLTAMGIYSGAQSALTGANALQYGPGGFGYGNLFGRTNWMNVLQNAMQSQYSAGNLQGYMSYKGYYDTLSKINNPGWLF